MSSLFLPKLLPQSMVYHNFGWLERCVKDAAELEGLERPISCLFCFIHFMFISKYRNKDSSTPALSRDHGWLLYPVTSPQSLLIFCPFWSFIWRTAKGMMFQIYGLSSAHWECIAGNHIHSKKGQRFISFSERKHRWMFLLTLWSSICLSTFINPAPFKHVGWLRVNALLWEFDPHFLSPVEEKHSDFCFAEGLW